MKINQVYNESCLDTLKKMPDDFLDCVITSPPYWQLRDYGYPEQWGLEPTFNEYLEHLWEMMDEIYRALKPEGTCWINLGDTYNGMKIGNTSNKGYIENKIIDSFKKEKIKNIKNKCLLLIPHRFAIGCIDRGWIVRNDIIWAKRNGMPESVTDRFSKKHEYFFFMVKSEKYYFDLDSIRDKHKESSLNRIEYGWKSEHSSIGNIDTDKMGDRFCNPKGKNPGDVSDFWDRKQYSVIDEKFRNEIVYFRELPMQEELRNYLSNARKKKGITIQEIEDIFGTQSPHHWFEKNGSFPNENDWIKIKEILNLDNTYDEQMTTIYKKSGLKENNPKGKNPGDVSDFWDVPTKPNKEKHYAQYSDDLIRKPILAGCPEGGLIYDPFMGSGSTADACIRTNRNFIGSEMSKEYFDICQNRINKLTNQQKLF